MTQSLFNPDDNREIILRIEKLTPDTKPLWGKMNASQMLSHCQAPIDVAFGNLKLKPNFFLLMLGRIYKNKILAAKGFKKDSPTAPDFIRNGDYDFEDSKAKLIERIKTFADEDPKAIKINKHPFFGKMTEEEWDNLQWKHLNHHLRQFGV